MSSYLEMLKKIRLEEQKVDSEAKNERKWFEKGAFEDGYQFGDVTRTILGTSVDVGENLTSGILGMGENIIDAGAYAIGGIGGLLGADKLKSNMQSFIQKDLYDEKKVAEAIILGKANSSVLGDKADSLIQSAGQLAGTIGLQAVGVPWYITSGVTSFGAAAEGALNEGASYGKAGLSAAISAGAEVLTEKLFGGSGLGEKGLINLEHLTKGISGKIVKALADFGLDMASEGAEEVVSQFASNLGSKLYREENLKDILFSEEAIDGYIESAIGGGVLGGIMNASNLSNSVKSGRDYRTGLSDNEKKVIDKVVADKIKEEGGKVSKKREAEIRDEAEKRMDKGYISTDIIEEVLGGDTFKSYKDTVDSEDALQNEFKVLNKMKQADMTGEQSDRRTELKQKLEELKNTSQRNQLKSQLGEEVFGLVKGDRLVESYNERGRRSQAFEADLTKYDTKYHGTIQKAIDSGILNNTNRTHEFVDMIAKISADKGVLFDFTDNAKLKESGFAVDGKSVNGYVTKDGITLNVNAEKALNKVVGHEVTHVLEGTELYKELQSAVVEYAKTKNDYQGRYDSLSKLYEGIEGADVDAELTADLVGDYLFTDPDFINSLSTNHRNVFQKIYDEVKYLVKVATAGSKEARELEKVKRAFENAYKEGGKASSGTKYSISETTDGRIAAVVDNDILSKIDTSSWDKTKKDAAKKAAANALKEFKDGIVVDGITRKVNRTSRREYTRSKDTEGLYNNAPDVFADKMRAAEVADDIVVAATNWNRDGRLEHPRTDNFVDFDHGKTLIVSGDAKYSAEVVVGITDTGEAVFYDVVDMTPTTFDTKKEESPTTATTQNAIGDIQGDSFEDNVAQREQKVKRDYSLTDSNGKELTKEQRDYFKDSKMRDENGNLKVMYHGSQDAGFHIFDAKMSDDETSFFFVDRNDVAASYSGTSETYAPSVMKTAEDVERFIATIVTNGKGYDVVEEDGKFSLYYKHELVADSDSAQGIYEEFCDFEGVGYGDANYKVYLNLKNPLEVDAEGRNWNNLTGWSKAANLKAEDATVKRVGDEFRLYKNGQEIENASIAVNQHNQNMDTEALKSIMVDKVNSILSITTEGKTTTREIAKWAKEHGYDGVIFKNIHDNGGYSNGSEGASTVAIAFDSNQIKSVANEKPTSDPDIRYSVSEDLPIRNDIALDDIPIRETDAENATVEDIPIREGVAQPTVEEKPKRILRADLHRGIMDNIKSVFSKRGFDFDNVLKNAKNLSTFKTVDNTPQRVMEKALGYKEGQALADLTVNKVAQNETEGIKWLNSFTDRKNGVLARISKQYNIKPGSKESAAAQMYAEGFYVADNGDIISYGDAELAQDFQDATVRNNIKALAKDERIRQIYDETLNAINESRRRNGYPEIPRLDNYYLHFRAMNDTFSRLGLPFNPNDIRAKDLPTDLNGVTADLKPGQPFFASSMHRTGKRTSFDLLGGLEQYLTSAKNQIYHIDDIQTLRALRNYIADSYGQAKGLDSLDNMSEEEAQERIEKVYDSHLSTFAKFLNEEANILAGKTSLIDRGLEGIIGRRGITFLDNVNRQVGSNMVGYNVSSSLTNFLSAAQAFAKTNKGAFLKAFSQTVANRLGAINGKADDFAEKSPVMIRRRGAERFNRTFWQKVSDPGYALMGAVDDISTELIARAKYNELTANGMESDKAHYETDKWVSRLMGDRSIGQMPQIYNSKMLGLVTKFQLEVRNQLDSQFYDTIQEAKASNEEIEDALDRNAKTAAKVTSTLFQLAIAQHIFGQAFESVAGYNPAFDIIEVLSTMFGWDDDEESEDTALDNIEQGFLELLEDLPYTSSLTGGGRIPISSALPIGQFISGKDQYGNEKARMETISEALPYYLLPGGYGQVKKSVQGLKMFDDDLPIAGSYTKNGNLRFSVEDTPLKRVQAGIFGQYASKEARDYFDSGRSPMSPEKHILSMAITSDVNAYRKYNKDMSEITADKDKAGNAIQGSKKRKVAEYINGLDLDYYSKIMLFKSQYNSDHRYNRQIISYLNDREDLAYDEKLTILRELGFEVSDDGRIRWG